LLSIRKACSPDKSVGSCGDRNNDTLLNKVIDCEVSAIEDVQEALLQSGNVDLVGLAWFGSVGDRVDFLMRPWNQTEGRRDSTLVEHARQLTALGLTNYQVGVEQACELARKVENNNNKTVVIMVSVFIKMSFLLCLSSSSCQLFLLSNKGI
jgi:hypothetical protein